MATTPVPAPVLDTRDGAAVTAQAISSLPAELSDRSDSNPAVVILEAAGALFDKFLYQLNRWPAAVIQKALALIGVTINPASAGIATQTFTLSSPQPNDTVIPLGTQVATVDGTIVYATLADLTIKAFTTPAGTITTASGSFVITGSGTTFPTDGSWNGWQIQTTGGAWYTIANYSAGAGDSATVLHITTAALSTVVAAAFNVGPITGIVSAQCTVAGLAGKVAAGALTALQSSPAGVASTTNGAAAGNAADVETTGAAIARAPTEFAARDVICSAADCASFAAKMLGNGGRAQARGNTNGTATQSGYMTVGLLSPSWTTTSAVSALERGAVIRDLQSRNFVGATLVDVPATIQTFLTTPNLFACCVMRKSSYDEASTQFAIAGAINTLLSPNTYPWGRTIFTTDLLHVVEDLTQVDRVFTAAPLGAVDANGNPRGGVPAIGMNYQVTANAVTFANGSNSATGTAGDFTGMIAGQTFLIDPTNKVAYLITNISSGTLTLHTPFAGTTGSFNPGWFVSIDTLLTNWYSLPYSSLATSGTVPASIVVVGVA